MEWESTADAKYFTNDVFNELQQLSGNQYVTSNFANNSNPLKSFKNKCWNLVCATSAILMLDKQLENVSCEACSK